jgi:hypothetical protein
MNATLIVELNPQRALPQDQAERIAWFEKFGILPDQAEVRVTADLRDWAAAGFSIQEDGTPYSINTCLGKGPLVDGILAIIRRTGKVPETLEGAEVKEILDRMTATKAA